jgi:hypothetical protein
MKKSTTEGTTMTKQAKGATKKSAKRHTTPRKQKNAARKVGMYLPRMK